MTDCLQVSVIIPALNEQDSVGLVISDLKSTSCDGVKLQQIVVVDNGSADNTAQIARDYGALVVEEKIRGYGAACLKGMAYTSQSDIVIFVDADGSDYAEQWPLLVTSILKDEADFVVGSRLKGGAEKGALLLQARFGNLLATNLMKMIYHSPFTDLGPFRAIRAKSLYSLGMEDMDFGWTVEMQLKALRLGLRCKEVSVSYRKRVSGSSKITGTLKGTVLAGRKILGLIAAECLWKAGFRKEKGLASWIK